MSSTAPSPSARPVPRRLLRLALLAAAWIAGALFAVAVGDALYSTSLPELRPWHTERLRHEFRASQADGTYDFAAYRAQEARLFEEVGELVRGAYDPAKDSEVSRYRPDRGPYAARVDRDWNRSFVLEGDPGRGVALVVHGLSDSPYSMRSIALALNRAGLVVYGLRLPGHGTIPAALDQARWEDWLAAVSLAVRQIRRDHPHATLWYAGYSTGATLGLKHAAQAVHAGRNDLLPTRLFLLSPALGVSPFAPLANVQRLVSRWGLAPKARWANVGPEIDPHKYESFAKNAGAQIASLIRSLYADLDRMDRDGSIGRLPPVTGFQSIVDATVSTSDLAMRFYGLLRGGTSELVLFDVNSRAGVAPLMSFSPAAVAEAFERAPRRDYRLTVLGNRDGAATLTERSWAPGSDAPQERPLGLAWPEDVYSLSHVAMPFPPDDPIYGLSRGRGPDGLPSLGALAFRGERGALAIAAADQLRLRANPFFDDMMRRILAQVEDGAGDAAAAATR
jgi:alpha-beta hydrolase superfamily lysophospholipase